jgi:hypothetical protein
MLGACGDVQSEEGFQPGTEYDPSAAWFWVDDSESVGENSNAESLVFEDTGATPEQVSYSTDWQQDINEAYQAYYDLLMQEIDKYGILAGDKDLIELQDYLYGYGDTINAGEILYAQLVDFNADELEELLYCVTTGEPYGVNFVIYTYDTSLKALVKIAEDSMYAELGGPDFRIDITTGIDGVNYLVKYTNLIKYEENAGTLRTYSTIKGGKWTEIINLGEGWDYDNDYSNIYEVNGKNVSESDYKNIARVYDVRYSDYENVSFEEWNASQIAIDKFGYNAIIGFFSELITEYLLNDDISAQLSTPILSASVNGQSITNVYEVSGYHKEAGFYGDLTSILKSIYGERYATYQPYWSTENNINSVKFDFTRGNEKYMARAFFRMGETASYVQELYKINSEGGLDLVTSGEVYKYFNGTGFYIRANKITVKISSLVYMVYNKNQENYYDIPHTKIVSPLELKIGSFSTMDEAALDWVFNYFAESFLVHREFAALIFQQPDGSFSYTWSIYGSAGNVNPEYLLYFIPEDSILVAGVHSHPSPWLSYLDNSPNFSDKDRDSAKIMIMYAAKVGGHYVIGTDRAEVHKLIYNSGTGGYEEIEVKNNFKLKALTPDRINELYQIVK